MRLQELHLLPQLLQLHSLGLDFQMEALALPHGPAADPSTILELFDARTQGSKLFAISSSSAPLFAQGALQRRLGTTCLFDLPFEQDFLLPQGLQLLTKRIGSTNPKPRCRCCWRRAPHGAAAHRRAPAAASRRAPVRAPRGAPGSAPPRGLLPRRRPGGRRRPERRPRCASGDEPPRRAGTARSICAELRREQTQRVWRGAGAHLHRRRRASTPRSTAARCISCLPWHHGVGLDILLGIRLKGSNICLHHL
mmetsp:Transcript_101967/g.283773  ORF Transcript_101967/g.283773 Transcript_101967/m.283773 type:complete len:252 (+) Transcript_101967:422-1177(+)